MTIHIVRSDGQILVTDSISYREAIHLMRDPDGVFEIVARPKRATGFTPIQMAIRANQVIAVEDWS